MEIEEIKMDPQLKLAIKLFFIREVPETYIGHAQDLADELEENLLGMGFDLETVVQYKSKKQK